MAGYVGCYPGIYPDILSGPCFLLYLCPNPGTNSDKMSGFPRIGPPDSRIPPQLIMSHSFTESIVEDATLDWFGELGYSQLNGQAIAPGEPAAKRATFGGPFLPERLHDALLPKLLSGELRVPVANS